MPPRDHQGMVAETGFHCRAFDPLQQHLANPGDQLARGRIVGVVRYGKVHDERFLPDNDVEKPSRRSICTRDSPPGNERFLSERVCFEHGNVPVPCECGRQQIEAALCATLIGEAGDPAVDHRAGEVRVVPGRSDQPDEVVLRPSSTL